MPALLEMTVRPFHARLPQGEDEIFGNAAEPEAARHDRHAVEEEPVERRFGAFVHFPHGPAFTLRIPPKAYVLGRIGCKIDVAEENPREDLV